MEARALGLHLAAGRVVVGPMIPVQKTRRVFPAAALLLFSANRALAGMTVYGLQDIHRLRLEEISFFLVLLLVCSFGLQLLWNYSFKGIAAIPRLKFLQALCASILFGLTSLLILTMISGIREVLTPDAWRRQGTSYRLNDPAQQPARERSMQHLRAALRDYARDHEGQYPPHDYVSEIPAKLWEAPDQHGTHYMYFGGLSINHTSAVVVVEPPNFGDDRYVLRASGEIELLPTATIRQHIGVKH